MKRLPPSKAKFVFLAGALFAEGLMLHETVLAGRVATAKLRSKTKKLLKLDLSGPISGPKTAILDKYDRAAVGNDFQFCKRPYRIYFRAREISFRAELKNLFFANMPSGRR